MSPEDGRAADLQPDPGAHYADEISIDLDALEPLISLPGGPDRVVPLKEAGGRKIDLAFIGTCTNGRLEDLQAAARVLDGKKIAPGVRLLVAPASRAIFTRAMHDGTAEILSAAGATFLPAGCGPCAGTHQGVPGDGEVVISSGSRNFAGRMGNREAQIYIASPAAVASAALAGEICDPAPYFA
jgi:3-isopropylmalate/(R)-2-methylmalate dehydratase large subunit